MNCEDDDSDNASRTSITVIPETSSEEVDDTDEERDDDTEIQPEITHSIVFKCIGCTKEHRYQEILCRAAQYLARGEDLPCIVEPEPSNPVDARAIAFKCKVDGL